MTRCSQQNRFRKREKSVRRKRLSGAQRRKLRAQRVKEFQKTMDPVFISGKPAPGFGLAKETQKAKDSRQISVEGHFSGTRVIDWIQKCEEPVHSLIDDDLKIPGLMHSIDANGRAY